METQVSDFFYPTYPSIDNDDFPRHDWEKHYGEVQEVIPKMLLLHKAKVLT